jgi:DNA-directed RNA polymerase specialized sigma24 family protein
MKDVNFLETTVDQWREALMPKDDPGLTLIEISDETGISLRTAQRRIRKLLKAGECKKGMATRTDSLGRVQRVPVYQMIEEE